jgi:hypothetical protein
VLGRVFFSKAVEFEFKLELNELTSLEIDNKMVYNVTVLLLLGRSPRTSHGES